MCNYILLDTEDNDLFKINYYFESVNVKDLNDTDLDLYIDYFFSKQSYYFFKCRYDNKYRDKYKEAYDELSIGYEESNKRFLKKHGNKKLRIIKLTINNKPIKLKIKQN